jgi:histidinol-phosphate aminotransferase
VSGELIRESVRGLTAYVPGEQPQGQKVIKLNTNENPYPPSPRVAETLQTLDVDALRKYPNPASDAVRERLAALHGCDVSNVFVGNGSDEVLALCTRAFVEDTGCVGYFDPSYSLYPVLADIRDVDKCAVPLTATFEWQTPASDCASLFFLTNPNAPTSMRFEKADVEAFCASFKGVVLVDEAYVDFADVDCMDLALKYENVLTMRTLSKSFSLAALRVGYVVGPATLIDALMKVKDSYNLDGVAQQVALAALNDIEYMRANADRIIASRVRLSADLQDLGFTVCTSQTNFLWVSPPEGVSAQDLFEKLREHGILTRYFPGPKTGQHIRITIGNENEVAALLAVVCNMVKGDIV